VGGRVLPTCRLCLFAWVLWLGAACVPPPPPCSGYENKVGGHGRHREFAARGGLDGSAGNIFPWGTDPYGETCNSWEVSQTAA
jgi:hypothetical protein